MSAKSFEMFGTKRRFGNVTVFETDGVRTVRLHQTDIVVCDVDGCVTLNSGGYKTMTTKTAINTALSQVYGVSAPKVVQRRGVWSILLRNGQSVPFRDGIIFGRGFQSVLQVGQS